MSIPDNDVKALYRQIKELKQITEQFDKRIEAIERYIIKLNEHGKKRDKQLGQYMKGQAEFANELFDSVKSVLDLVKAFLP